MKFEVLRDYGSIPMPKEWFYMVDKKPCDNDIVCAMYTNGKVHIHYFKDDEFKCFEDYCPSCDGIFLKNIGDVYRWCLLIKSSKNKEIDERGSDNAGQV